MMNADGTVQRALTDDPAWDVYPVITPDGRYIVFASDRNGKAGLWRMDIDGNKLKRLTNASSSSSYDVTPDGQSVIYTTVEADKIVIRGMPIDGGSPVQIGVTTGSDSLCVSPDGKLLAYFSADPTARTGTKLAVMPVTGGSPVKTFDVLLGAAGSATDLKWSPDGRALVYIGPNPGGGAPALWRQSLDGGAPTLVADFSPDSIYAFAYSRDGKQLALVRGNQTSDAVLISEVK